VVTATIRFHFDGRSTAYQRSLRSQSRSPLAAITPAYLRIYVAVQQRTSRSRSSNGCRAVELQSNGEKRFIYCVVCCVRWTDDVERALLTSSTTETLVQAAADDAGKSRSSSRPTATKSASTWTTSRPEQARKTRTVASQTVLEQRQQQQQQRPTRQSRPSASAFIYYSEATDCWVWKSVYYSVASLS